MDRIMISGVSSGCGKTTVVCAVLQALVNRGLKTGAFKCGPDYIDPMFHSRIIGAKSANLDLHFFSENTLRFLLAKNAAGCDVSVIEGAMGFYDGAGLTTWKTSAYELALVTKTPVVLVVNARGAALSVLAVIEGFLRFRPESGIRGVILNQCTAMTYASLSAAIEERFGIRCFGFLPRLDECVLESRHLGLVPAEEVEDALPRIQEAARQVADTLDLPMILELARRAPVLPVAPRKYPRMDGFRMGLARDKAFSFYYRANLDALEGAGVELVPFSPLEDGELPKGLDGLYLGGGFPEVFKVRLSANISMRQSIRTALESGMPCYAECGGMMYLSESIDSAEMVGFLPQVCRMTDRLQRFGYVLVADLKTGRTYPAHEFHHAATEATGEAAYDFEIRKASRPELCWPGGMHKGNTTAGFAHLHFLSHPEWMERLWR